SFLFGLNGSLLVTVLTLLWAMRMLSRASPSALLAGASPEATTLRLNRPRWAPWIGIGSLVLALGLTVVGFYATDSEERASAFFGSGALFLTATLAAIWLWLRRSRNRPITGHGAG